VPQDGSGAIVGVVGALQLDVLKERLQAEYGLPIDYEPTRFSICRWIASDDRIALDRFVDSHLSAMARDLDEAPVFMAANNFNLQYEMDRAKGITFSDVKDYQKKAA
jgi:peptide chain release factor 3